MHVCCSVFEGGSDGLPFTSSKDFSWRRDGTFPDDQIDHQSTIAVTYSSRTDFIDHNELLILETQLR